MANKQEISTEIEINKFKLPNKVVTLIPIIRSTTFMGTKDHDGVFMYTGTSQTWCIFRDEYGNYKDPLNPTERSFLEKELLVDLNPYHKENYWKEFEVKIFKDTYELSELKLKLDLSKAKDYLSYKLLLTAPDVAPSLSAKDDTPEYRWVLVEQDETIQDKLSKGKKKAYCYKWLTENANKSNILRDVLYIMNVTVSINNTRDELESIITDIIESNKLDNFYDVLNDPNLDTNILFAKALKARVIIVKFGKYYNVKGDVLATTKDKMLEWLVKPENSVEVELMKETINKIKI